ncbi:hypothetical protein [Pseudoalteromonas spongiae]|uniref:hypothetical protein n=1 Tax=Pseudoalteromonas spongiae TaxID=298657 RepID=UPI00110AA271|nr:hypothetical protein [Pseudoalteromonas spongiae]TMO84208.1 hypothetical protein CWC15_11415 [Pseudoalteromonas spongiae]
MSEGSYIPIIVSFIIFALSTIIVIIGWGKIYLNGRKLASRSEVMTLKSSLLNKIDSLESEAIEFWAFENPKEAPSQDKCILFTKVFSLRIHNLAIEISYLYDLAKISSGHSKELARLQRNITLNMERASNIEVDDRVEKITQISQKALEIRKGINDSLISKFKFIEP